MITVYLHNLILDRRGVRAAGESGDVGVLVQGHSLYREKGSDIVCAAISALSQTMIRSIDMIGDIPQELDQREGFLRTRIAFGELDGEKKNSTHAHRLLHDRGDGDCTTVPGTVVRCSRG
ncbi:MAG: ribosomal-processing cysteine protease Prp [Spirochaetes bacterium]|nr:ribosomal-processing cysteine protease Prp [Spirochaetota bacterium]